MSDLNLMTRLREATREAHGQLETLPYFRALFQGGLPLESYVGHLRSLAVLHGALERELAKAEDPRLKAVWSENLTRFPKLQADLDHLSPKAVLDIAAAADAARTLAGQVLRRSAGAPVSLLGYLYVLEGSVGGAKVLAPRFGQAFGLDQQHGLAYFTWDPATAEARWREFSENMNAAQVDEAEREAITTAAEEAFAGLRQVFAALYPFEGTRLTRDVTSLNPEAGDHPVPADPGEMDAALRAALRCWQEFPYLSWRFGERGWRFTQSDGAWLVTLAAQDQAVVLSQIEWLGGVLASRGLPRLLLQRKLELLYEELRGRVPEVPGPGYGRLLVAADHLADQRRAHICDADLEAMTGRFELAIGPDWRSRLPRTGVLLVCAAADRAFGIEQAVGSLEGWFTDPQRFPPTWIAAVRETLKEAQARTSSHPG